MSNERIEITIEEILAAMAYADARFWDAHSAANKQVMEVYSK